MVGLLKSVEPLSQQAARPQLENEKNRRAKGGMKLLLSLLFLGSVSKPLPLVNIKIAGKWMFIPLKMVLIGIDPYPYALNLSIFGFTTCVSSTFSMRSSTFSNRSKFWAGIL